MVVAAVAAKADAVSVVVVEAAVADAANSY